ncbi:unnamed protein product [Musa acuminata subsp. malaccensis]|uniref:(wild Malaysian banana) hypothetical protein n=1 Tax=Musa acuminata subsp. malaccensis TaxID=214687 RepID=A0A804HNV7_MUSAM|nr:unnamed protein product [Musa acuminata subsp. malaccensis]
MLMIHITLIIMSLFNTHRCLVPDLEKASHSCTLSPTFAPGHGLVLLIPGARVSRMVFLQNGASCSRFHIFRWEIMFLVSIFSWMMMMIVMVVVVDSAPSKW